MGPPVRTTRVHVMRKGASACVCLCVCEQYIRVDIPAFTVIMYVCVYIYIHTHIHMLVYIHANTRYSASAISQDEKISKLFFMSVPAYVCTNACVQEANWTRIRTCTAR
jgi:hypothetical protein